MSQKGSLAQEITIEYIRSLCDEVDVSILNPSSEDCHAFFDYYEARGWKINNNPIVNIKALFKSWLNRRQQFLSNPTREDEKAKRDESYARGMQELLSNPNPERPELPW